MDKEMRNDLAEDIFDMPEARIVIELPGGQRISTNDYVHDVDKNGKSILIILAGRKLKST